MVGARRGMDRLRLAGLATGEPGEQPLGSKPSIVVMPRAEHAARLEPLPHILGSYGRFLV